jgi:hypothetical protein
MLQLCYGVLFGWGVSKISLTNFFNTGEIAMNEELKKLLSTLYIDGNLRVRLNKIFDKSEPVTEIDLRGYEHGKRLDVRKEDLLVLLQVCKAVPNLQAIAFFGYELDDDSAFKLASAMESMGNLNVIDICGSNIGDGGAVKIADAISRHGSIKSFCLNGDAMGNQAAVAIVKAVADNRNITGISVQGKHISNVGILSLLNLLSLNRLKQMVIIGETADYSTCKGIGEKLARDNTLQSFVLEVDSIDNFEVVLDGIRINSFLTDVILVAHNLEQSKLDAIEKTLEAIKLRNAQGIYQRKIDDVLIYARECFGLRTHTLDKVFSEKFTTMITTNITVQISFFEKDLVGGVPGVGGSPAVGNLVNPSK